MSVSRREFLGGLAVTFASAFARRLSAEAAANEPLLRFGALSDTHLRVTDDPGQLGRVFRWLHGRNADAVVISGDITEQGLNTEIDYLVRIWNDAFPGGCAADGRKVEKFWVWGNHDYSDASYMRRMPPEKLAEQIKVSVFGDKDAAWRRIGEGAFPGETFTKTIKGFSFVGTHWKHEDETVGWLKAHPEVDTSKFFVYVQHPQPPGTVFYPARKGKVYKGLREEMRAYSNCFMIAGHSHVSVSDDRALWQGDFTVMGAGSTKSVSVRRGYENSPGTPESGKYVPHTRAVESGKPSQGSLVSVYRDKVIVERVEFRSGEVLGDAWELPLPLERHPDEPFVIAAQAPAPEFPEGAKVEAALRPKAKDRLGRTEAQVKVWTPYAQKRGRYGRVVDYLFEAVDAASGKVLLSRQTLQDYYTSPEAQAKKYGGRCKFAVADLPAGASVQFRVTPRNAAGKGGRSLVSKPFAIPPSSLPLTVSCDFVLASGAGEW